MYFKILSLITCEKIDRFSRFVLSLFARGINYYLIQAILGRVHLVTRSQPRGEEVGRPGHFQIVLEV